MNLSRSLRTYVATHLTLMLLAVAACSRPPLPASGNAINIDRLDVTVPKLQQLYADKRYTVTQVVQWHLAASIDTTMCTGPLRRCCGTTLWLTPRGWMPRRQKATSAGGKAHAYLCVQRSITSVDTNGADRVRCTVTAGV